MPKHAGELRDRIRIDQDLGATVNVIGDAVPDWQPLITGTDDGMIWANVAPMSAGEQWRRLQMNAEANWKVTIRHRTDITPRMRVVFGPRVMEIRGIVNPDMKRRFLELACEELVAADIVGAVP
jgi:SPP1 family predicted phage head-tail adaptor